ncbi:hypothetical protein ACFL40_05920 [candidate division KSB1 bacterium]
MKGAISVTRRAADMQWWSFHISITIIASFDVSNCCFVRTVSPFFGLRFCSVNSTDLLSDAQLIKTRINRKNDAFF